MAVEAQYCLLPVRGRGVADDAIETKQRRGDLASTPHDAVVGPPVHVVPATGTQSGAAFFANNADALSRKRAHKEDEFVGAAKRRVIDVAHPAVLHHVQRLNAEVQHWRRYAAAAARQLRAKDEEVDAARWLNLLLQEQAHAAHAEARVWRDAAAAVLPSDLGHALSAQARAPAAEHAESCCSSSNSNNGGEEGGDACRGCGERGAAVVLLPCRHLSACTPCAAAARACPACGTPNAGSVAVNPM
ncbi:hypothetical protein QOZ80_6AG0509110 [Eleusine coracana subsp. coracana]|nr:hypothetical protein QOZ80_6AG0509110 [Eleusine coracana subsp. coracana]